MRRIPSAEIIDGITAYTLPTTKAESSEIFLYDLVVQSRHRRNGVGRCLLNALCENSSEAGIHDLFAPPITMMCVRARSHFYCGLGGAPSPVTVFTFSLRGDARP